MAFRFCPSVQMVTEGKGTLEMELAAELRLVTVRLWLQSENME